MNAASAAHNRWGDPPLVVQGRLSRLAVWAFSLAIAAAWLAFIRELLTSAAADLRPLAALLAPLLTLLQ